MKKVSDSLTFRYRGLIGVICLFPIGTVVIFSFPLIAEDTFVDLAMDALGWFCFVEKDDTGWGVYEEARRGGAIIATAHDHSYGRTYLMDSFVHQTIASRSNTMTITEGKTFAFFTGLGGKSVYAQELNGSWWANIYTRTQGATYGALFGVFKVDGAPNKATFYFKNIKGEIIDRFDVISTVHINATEAK